jgi:hypothetical protein
MIACDRLVELNSTIAGRGFSVSGAGDKAFKAAPFASAAFARANGRFCF